MKVKLMHQVQEANEELGAVAQFESNGFVFVAELKDCDIKDFEQDKEYEVNVTFYGHAVYGVYKNEEEFQEDNPGMAETSYIPVGAFSVNPDDKDWEPSPMNLINCIVSALEDNAKVGAPDNLVLFYSNIEGQEVDMCLWYQSSELKDDVQPGYIVSGLYWAELRLLNKEPKEETAKC